MRLLPRLRLLLARHPVAYWTTVAALAALAAWSVDGRVQRVDDARAAWGTTTAVWVASADAVPGDSLHAGRRDLPAAMVPEGALADLPAGATAAQHVGRGEVLTLHDVHDPESNGLAGDEVGVPLRAVPGAVAGASVRVFALGAELADGRVVATFGDDVLVAVPAGAASAVSLAAADGTATIGLIGP